MLAELWCDQKTRDKLGGAGLTQVTACLWAQDCQACGHALGPEPPALCVDELSGYATAGLHHRRCCRPPGWNDSSLIITASGDVLSWQACAILLPGMPGRQPDPRPALLVNPGLEQITLKPPAAPGARAMGPRSTCWAWCRRPRAAAEPLGDGGNRLAGRR